MGEMADYYIALGLDAGRNPYGRRSHSYARPPAPACKRCGAKAVYWVQENGHWRLYQKGTGAPHLCPTTADGFDEVPDA